MHDQTMRTDSFHGQILVQKSVQYPRFPSHLHHCCISTDSSWVWGYTEACSRAPGPGLTLCASGSRQTPWWLRTAAWLSWSSPTRLWAQAFQTGRGGSTQTGRTPGQKEEGDRGLGGRRILGSLCLGQYRCDWHLMHKQKRPGVKNHHLFLVWLHMIFHFISTNAWNLPRV